MLFVLWKPLFPAQVLFVPVVYSGVLPGGHLEEEDGVELVGEWAVLGDPLVTFWLWWHLLCYLLGVQSLSVWKLVVLLVGIKANISVRKPSLNLSTHMHFCYFGEIIFLKKNKHLLFFLLKRLSCQFLIRGICLRVWNSCRCGPPPLGCAESPWADLFTLISQVEASSTLPESNVLSITFQNWQLSQYGELYWQQ